MSELWNVTVHVWQAIGPIVPLGAIGGFITVLVVQAAKKWALDPANKKRLVLFKNLVAAGVIVVHVLMQLASQIAPDNLKVAAIKALIVSAAGSGIWTFIFKPVWAILSNAADSYKASKTTTEPTTTFNA